ncbi:MAG: type II secretion system F family protein [Hyphomicrobiales bacterium]|nr:type II secretion system F family protein [Hyphomicrobiales bacterium]
MQNMALFFLVAVAMGGVAWVFLYPILSGEKKAEKRKDSFVGSASSAPVRASRNVQKSRREQVEGTLKELDQRRAKSTPLPVKISQAGLDWSTNRFYMTAGGLAVAGFIAGFMLNGGLLASAGLAFAGGFGLPLWLLKFLKKRREQKFLASFPDAVDVIVRGIKAGLPLFDSLRIISLEAPEPLKSEFRAIIETQTIGIPIGEACAKLYERVPLPEANFFGIVISIQQKSGGNLSEALGNLSRVLRDRKKMKAKIQAMSMEAKASASIIACLPIAVMTLVYITSPQYIELLWTEPMGRMMLACCAAWMTLGVLVMRKMINFDF